MKKNIRLDVYHGIEASVNAYIFSDDQSIILVDCLRNSEEAKSLAETIKKHNKLLTHILITHGHPDHYLGMNVMKQEFPKARIVVRKQEIKDDIITFSGWMEGVGWLEKEPAMKPQSAENPNGFDYENNIGVLPGKTLSLTEGAVLELNSDYLPSECEHLTTIYCEDLNAFFSSDFCYNAVHMWLAVEKTSISNWKMQLDRFKKDLTATHPTIYPGHGKPSDISLFDEVKKYIEDFEETIANAESRAQAMETMQSLYPHHQQADFLLFNSVNALIPE